MKFSKLLSLAFWLAAFASLAHAHPGHDGHDFTWSFANGALHPLTGWDHLCTMIAVGLWAALLGGRARWALPAAFIGTMTLAALIAPVGSSFSGLEQAIAASVLVLGALVAFRVRVPLPAAISLVAAFAAFHGWAHGAEMPAGSSEIQYLSGFILTTALLHVAGLGLYSVFQYATQRRRLARS